MAIRNYVGARYVPKFADHVEWQANTSYEAMVIVTYNNSSYTSKISVPPTVGNPAENPMYWALTGNYNAQVEQYRQETETVSNNLTTEITKRKNVDTILQDQITTEITNRKNTDTTLQGQITTEITNRKNADTTLQDNINSEAARRASADSNLQSQINQIVAPSGEAPSVAEVQNARIGADGVTYDTLGTAIRTQVNNLNEDIVELINYETQYLFSSKFIKNKVYIDKSSTKDDSGSCIYPPFKINGGKTYYYMHLRGVFCWIKDLSTNEWHRISSDDKEARGSYTPTNDSVVYITVGNNDKTLAFWSTVELTDTTRVEGKFNTELNKPKYDVSELKYDVSELKYDVSELKHDVSELKYDASELINKNRVFYCGADKEFTTFKSVLLEATKYKNATIYLDNGVYDIYQEEGGENFFANYHYSEKWYGGLVLKNGVKIYASSGAILKFNYNGNNAEVKTHYSPLNAGSGGFELHNVTVNASNCRYAIHDEKMDYEDVYRSIYDHCHIMLNNSANDVWEGKNCIGGGLGRNGEIYITGCIFESITSENSTFDIVSYHNSSNPNAKSAILIENTILKGNKGRFKFGYHGTSKNMTNVIICGCKAPNEPLLWQETPSDNTVNIEITQWNNTWG